MQLLKRTNKAKAGSQDEWLQERCAMQGELLRVKEELRRAQEATAHMEMRATDHLATAHHLAEQNQKLLVQNQQLATGHVHLEAQLEAVLGELMESGEDDMPLDTPANCIIRMTDLVMDGQMPSPELVARVRTAVLRRHDIYAVTNLGNAFSNMHMDRDVQRNMMMMLGQQDSRLPMDRASRLLEDESQQTTIMKPPSRRASLLMPFADLKQALIVMAKGILPGGGGGAGTGNRSRRSSAMHDSLVDTIPDDLASPPALIKRSSTQPNAGHTSESRGRRASLLSTLGLQSEDCDILRTCSATAMSTVHSERLSQAQAQHSPTSPGAVLPPAPVRSRRRRSSGIIFAPCLAPDTLSPADSTACSPRTPRQPGSSLMSKPRTYEHECLHPAGGPEPVSSGSNWRRRLSALVPDGLIRLSKTGRRASVCTAEYEADKLGVAVASQAERASPLPLPQLQPALTFVPQALPMKSVALLQERTSEDQDGTMIKVHDDSQRSSADSAAPTAAIPQHDKEKSKRKMVLRSYSRLCLVQSATKEESTEDRDSATVFSEPRADSSVSSHVHRQRRSSHHYSLLATESTALSEACRGALSQAERITPLLGLSESAGFHCPQPILFEEAEVILGHALTDMKFNSFELSRVTGGRPLSTLCWYLFHHNHLITTFRIDTVRFVRWLQTIELGYTDNPYHNATHAADVLQTLHVVLHSANMVGAGSYVDPLTLMACYLAATIHDYEHQGLTNDYLVNTSHPLAIIYNDKAPLENHHLAAAFAAMRSPGLNFLRRMPKADYDKLRKMVIELVLATDMKHHFALYTSFTNIRRRTSFTNHPALRPSFSGNSGSSTAPLTALSTTLCAPGPSSESADHVPAPALDSASQTQPIAPVEEAERLLSIQIAFKLSDLGHIAEGLDVHLRWVAALEEEFFLQGDRERAAGLPITPLFDRHKPGVTKSQVGFLEVVVLPLLKAFVNSFPGAKLFLVSAWDNYRYWRAKQPSSASDEAPTVTA